MRERRSGGRHAHIRQWRGHPEWGGEFDHAGPEQETEWREGRVFGGPRDLTPPTSSLLGASASYGRPHLPTTGAP
jgi:hypothetical protein